MAVVGLKSDVAYGQIEARLINELVALCEPTAHLSARSGSKCDRWLLASSLQKCVRRGLCQDATKVACLLHNLDKDYAWRRLRIIALEDIGLGGIDVVAATLAIAGKRQVRAALGDLSRFLACVQSLATSTKDRTACDLLTWINSSPDALAARQHLLDDARSWESLALDVEAPIWRRAIAIQLLGGHALRTKAGYRTVSKADYLGVRRVIEALGVPPLVAYVALKGRATDSLNLSLIFAHLLNEAADCRPTISHETMVRTPPKIGGLIAPSFCMYTRVGLNALRQFLRTTGDLRLALAEAGSNNLFATVGLLIFQVESGLLDRVEEYAPQVRIEAERAELAQFGVTDDSTAAALRLCAKENLANLNLARRSAWRAYLKEQGAGGDHG